MKRFLSAAFGLAIALLISTPSQGAIELLFPNVVNKLEDNDWDSIANVAGSSTTLDVDDILFGMYEIQRVVNNVTNDPNNPTTTTFTGVFAQAVLTKTGPGGGQFTGGFRFTFRPLTVAEYAGLVAALPAMPARSDPNTILFVFDDPEDVAGPPAGPFVDPSNGSINTSLGTATNGTLLWEFGFDDGDETFVADADTDVLASTAALDFRAWLNLTHTYPAGSGVAFSDHLTIPAPILGGGPAITAVLSELQIRGGLEDGGNPGDFAIPTDTDVFVLPHIVPEPSSMTLLLGLSALGSIGFGLRRRRHAA